MTLPKSGGPEWPPGGGMPETTGNEIARRLDSGYSRAIIEDRDLAAAPGTCDDGACYLVAATPDGGDLWAGQTGKLAVAIGDDAINGWEFITVAVKGFRAYIRDENAEIIHNGSAWVSAEPGSMRPIAFFFTTTPTASEVLLLYTAVESLTLGNDFGGSVGACGTNPAASFVLDVQKNGAAVGTITISTSGGFTFATTGGSVSLVASDVLKVIGPVTPDDDCADVSITLLAAL
jgi:hypothetical protein